MTHDYGWDALEARLEANPEFVAARERLFPDREATYAMCRARARREMTQKEFAKLLGIPLKALRLIESGNFG